MNRRGVLAGAAGLAGVAASTDVAYAAVTPSPPPDSYADGTYSMWCLGDSITFGSSSDPANGGNGYRSHLLDALRGPNETHALGMVGSVQSGSAGLWHDGHPGWTINQIAGLVNPAGLAPQFVVFLGGANDFGDANLHTAEQAIADTGALIDGLLAWAPWVRVVVCEQILMSGAISHDLTKSTWQQQAYNAALPALADARNGRVAIAKTSVISQGMLDASGVHPTDVGYQWMAYVIYQALAPWLGHPAGGSRWMTNIPVPGGSPRPIGGLV